MKPCVQGQNQQRLVQTGPVVSVPNFNGAKMELKTKTHPQKTSRIGTIGMSLDTDGGV